MARLRRCFLLNVWAVEAQQVSQAWVSPDFCGDDQTHFVRPFSALQCVIVTKEEAAHWCSLCTDDVLTGSCSEMVMGCFSFHGSLHSHHALIDTHAHPVVCVINKLNILLLSYLIRLQCHATVGSAMQLVASSYYLHIQPVSKHLGHDGTGSHWLLGWKVRKHTL